MEKEKNITSEQETERLREQLKRQEKLASLGMLSAGIAHEIRNPLNFVINFSRTAERMTAELREMWNAGAATLPEAEQEDAAELFASLTENLQRIAEHGNRAISILQGILLYSRGKADEYVPTDSAWLTQEYVRLAYHAMRANYPGFNTALEEHYEEDLPPVRLVPQDFSRVVLNLVNNACYAVWEKQQKAAADYRPTIGVELRRHEGNLMLSVTDNGTGMSEEVQRKLYDAFFSTKPAGHGTGLGMAIVKSIVEKQHHGHIDFHSKPGEYTCFTLSIPMNL